MKVQHCRVDFEDFHHWGKIVALNANHHILCGQGHSNILCLKKTPLECWDDFAL
jgi:hypothetical protein